MIPAYVYHLTNPDFICQAVREMVVREHDDVVPLERADALIAAVPDGRKIIMAGGSHAPYMGNPEAFHAHLLAFARQCCQL